MTIMPYFCLIFHYVYWAEGAGLWYDKEGTIDYVALQLYWHIGFKIADYHVLLDWWHRAALFTSLDLCIGHGAYQTGHADPLHLWHGAGEIQRQLNLKRGYSGVAGNIFYHVSALARNLELQMLLANFYKPANSDLSLLERVRLQ